MSLSYLISSDHNVFSSSHIYPACRWLLAMRRLCFCKICLVLSPKVMCQAFWHHTVIRHSMVRLLVDGVITIMLSCSSLCFSAFESIWQAKSATERFNWKDLPALSLQVCGHTKVPGPRSPCVADQTCYSAKPGAAWGCGAGGPGWWAHVLWCRLADLRRWEKHMKSWLLTWVHIITYHVLS